MYRSPCIISIFFRKFATMTIKTLIDRLHQEQCSLVLLDTSGRIRTFGKPGVRDLEYLLDHEPQALRGARIADKVVGKAAAGMMVVGGVREVYADVMSRKALPLFDDAHIDYSFGVLTDQIVIPEGDTRCPLEQIVAPADTAEQVVEMLRAHFREKISEAKL